MLCYEYKAGLPINPPSGTKVSKVSHTLQNIMKLTKDSFQLRLRLMVYQNIHLGCRHIWFDLMSGLFCPRLAPTLFCNSTNLNKQLLFPIGSPNCTLSTFQGVGVVRICVSKENPKSDLDNDLGFVNSL